MPPSSTGPFHKLILANEDFMKGEVDTGFIPKHIDDLNIPPKEPKTKIFLQVRETAQNK